MKKRKIKYCLLIGLTIIALVFVDINIYATTYYISTSGDDKNSGIRKDQPWQSLEKVNRFAFSPGDQILFKTGDTWTGTITVTASGTLTRPITYGAWGDSTKPIISGFTTISGWTNEGNGIYSKEIAVEGGKLNMVTVDGINTAMGRWPNAGTWNTYENHVDNISITDNQLIGSQDWDGAEAVVRFTRWALRRNTITDHTNKTLTWAVDKAWSQTNGYGYFIQNHITTLDQLGEWYYDGNDLYMYFGTVNPETKEVKIATSNELFVVSNGKSYITVNNISFEGANKSGIDNRYYNTSITQGLVTVSNCSFNHMGVSAIAANNATAYKANMKIDNNTISHCNSQGIVFAGSTIIGEITNNNISDCR